jgi:hypothetical protein
MTWEGYIGMRLILKVLRFLAFWRCRWHKGEPAASYEPDGEAPAYCPDCGRMLETRICERCGRLFLDWQSETRGDDILSGPLVDDSGDLCCRMCYVPDREEDEDEEEWDREPDDDCDPAAGGRSMEER